jgi:hypothetical protein
MINDFYKQFLISLNTNIVIVAVVLSSLNIFLLIAQLMYAKNNYFRVLERINFNDVESSLKLVKNLNNLDEYGNMGSKLKVLLETYLKFSQIKKLKLEFEQKKFNVLMNMFNKGALTLVKDSDLNFYKVKYLNNKAVDLLNLQDKRSLIIGKEFVSIIDESSGKVFEDIVDSFEFDSIEDIFDNVLEMDIIELELKIQSNLATIIESKDKEQVFKNFNLKLIPFVFKWPDKLIDENNEAIKNSIVDNLLVIFEDKKVLW